MDRYPPQQQTAIKRVEEYLLTRDDTFATSLCEEDTIFGREDSNIIWHFNAPSGVVPIPILVRSEKFEMGELYFETSHDVVNDPTCSSVMQSEATYLFHLYLDTGLLFILPLRQFREWVMDNIDSFRAEYVETDGRKASGRFIPLYVVEGFPRAQRIVI